MQAIIKRPLFSGSALLVAAAIAAVEWLIECRGKRRDVVRYLQEVTRP